jgi:hypothetical protein
MGGWGGQRPNSATAPPRSHPMRPSSHVQRRDLGGGPGRHPWVHATWLAGPRGGSDSYLGWKRMPPSKRKTSALR